MNHVRLRVVRQTREKFQIEKLCSMCFPEEVIYQIKNHSKVGRERKLKKRAAIVLKLFQHRFCILGYTQFSDIESVPKMMMKE